MAAYNTLSKEALSQELEQLQKAYDGFKARNLSLDMSRGKPSKEQLDLSLDMLDVLTSKDQLVLENGMDARNYGGVDGIPEAKALFAQMLEVRPSEVIIGGNSSLTMMHDTLVRAMLHGVKDSDMPWGKLPKVKFLCPSPGYDRHFLICEYLNIEMITVDMTSDGPNMDQVEQLVKEDESIKGIWCVPKYSNPDGITYSDEVVDRLAKMETKADDFRIFWDNAYTVHHLTDTPDELKNILDACADAGNPDRVFIFGSTSKITFAGAGVAAMASSEANIEFIKKQLNIQTIGPDKLNQLRHVRYFKNMDGLHEHMKKHAALIRPKFDKVIEILETQLGPYEVAQWNKPNGGYFISLNTLDGCAKKVVSMAGEAGVIFTNAGATFPYGNDPRDRNIRIAPTMPTIEELATAIEVLCLCVKIASIKKLLSA